MKLVTTTFVELSDAERKEMRGLRQRSKMTLKEVARRAGSHLSSRVLMGVGRPAPASRCLSKVAAVPRGGGGMNVVKALIFPINWSSLSSQSRGGRCGLRWQHRFAEGFSKRPPQAMPLLVVHMSSLLHRQGKLKKAPKLNSVFGWRRAWAHIRSGGCRDEIESVTLTITHVLSSRFRAICVSDDQRHVPFRARLITALTAFVCLTDGGKLPVSPQSPDRYAGGQPRDEHHDQNLYLRRHALPDPAGDWVFADEHRLQITVAGMGDRRISKALIGVHELDRGAAVRPARHHSPRRSTRFDKMFRGDPQR